MLVTDDASWPQYFIHELVDGSGGLVYRYDHPDQPGPWLRWTRDAYPNTRWGDGTGTYGRVLKWRMDGFRPTTEDELIHKFGMSSAILLQPLPVWQWSHAVPPNNTKRLANATD